MTKPNTNSFNGANKPAKVKTTERIALVAHMLDNPGPHTYDQLMAATGYSRHITESRMRAAAEDNEVVNTSPAGKPAQWQHREHYKPIKPTDLVSRRDSICNAGMPNGSRSYWARQMAVFNTPPRAV